MHLLSLLLGFFPLALFHSIFVRLTGQAVLETDIQQEEQLGKYQRADSHNVAEEAEPVPVLQGGSSNRSDNSANSIGSVVDAAGLIIQCCIVLDPVLLLNYLQHLRQEGH